MPRVLSTTFRNQLQMRDSPALILCFATITHADIPTGAFRVVSEDVNGVSRSSDGKIINYKIGGVLYQGLPFFFDLVSDNDESPPKARVWMPDVDRAIGLEILPLLETPIITFHIYKLSDFSLSLDVDNARSPSGSPTTPEYTAPYMTLRNCTGDYIMVQADLGSFDFTSEPCPYHRVTKDDVPGAYWE